MDKYPYEIKETRIYYHEYDSEELKQCVQTSLLRWCTGWLKLEK